MTVQLAVATAAELGGAGAPGEPGATPDAALQARIVGAASSARPPVILADQTAALRQLSLASYFSASMAILFLFFSAQMGLVSLFDERRQGTLGRILAGPVKPWTVLGGKLLGGFGQGMLAMTVLVVATTLLIGASWGSPLGVALVCTSAVIAALGISTLVISFTNSAEVAGAASSAVAITLGVLGGSSPPPPRPPRSWAPSRCSPRTGWFMRGLGDMQGGGTVADGLPAVGVLLAMGLVTGGIGMARARRLVKAR